MAHNTAPSGHASVLKTLRFVYTTEKPRPLARERSPGLTLQLLLGTDLLQDSGELAAPALQAGQSSDALLPKEDVRDLGKSNATD